MANRKSKNKVNVLGNATADFSFLSASNNAVAFSIATNEVWRDKNTGQQQEKTEYHRCIAFNNDAEYLVKHARKGSLIDVEGKLQHRKWQDQQGNDRITTEIVVIEVQILDGWKSNEGQSTSTHNKANENQPSRYPQASSSPHLQSPVSGHSAIDFPPPAEADDVPGFHEYDQYQEQNQQ